MPLKQIKLNSKAGLLIVMLNNVENVYCKQRSNFDENALK